MDAEREPGLHWEGDRLVVQPRPATNLRAVARVTWALVLAGMLVTLLIQDEWSTVSILAAASLALALVLFGLSALLRARDPRFAERDPNAPVEVPADLLEEVRDCNRADRRIDGVKLIRERTGLDLQSAAQVAKAAGPPA